MAEFVPARSPVGNLWIMRRMGGDNSPFASRGGPPPRVRVFPSLWTEMVPEVVETPTTCWGCDQGPPLDIVETASTYADMFGGHPTWGVVGSPP